MSSAFSVLFVVIVWLTEMVISIHQRIFFFFPRKRAGEKGLGERTWKGGKQRGGHCARGATAGRISRNT